MIRKKDIGQSALRFLVILMAASIFILDLTLPAFNTGGILFQTLFILSLWIPSRQNNLLLATLCTFFIITGYWWRHGVSVDTFDLFSRFLSTLGVWSIAIVGSGKDKILMAAENRERRIKTLIEERTFEDRENFTKKNQALQFKLRQMEDETVELRQKELKHRAEKDTALAHTLAYSSFLNEMGTEMQVPMHSVAETATSLAETPLDNKQREHLYTIRSSAESLLSLTNDLLDYSKVEAGQIEINQGPFVLRHCIETAFDMVVSRATKKNIELSYNIDPSIPVTIVSDEQRVKQIITNLLGNAVQRSEKGDIVLHAKLLEKTAEAYLVYFSIHDSGPNIPVDQVDELFKHETRDEVERLKRITDIGIGLSLSNRLCNLLKGKIWVESEEGHGANFQFVIPVQKAARQNIPLQGKPWFIGKHALIVDNNPNMCRFLNHQLKNWGMQTTVLQSGPDAMRWYSSDNICDLAIIDLDMPILDGLTLAHQIRQNNNTLPIILMTSQGEYISDASISATLVKPVKQKILYNHVNAILSLTSATSEEYEKLKSK